MLNFQSGDQKRGTGFVYESQPRKAIITRSLSRRFHATKYLSVIRPGLIQLRKGFGWAHMLKSLCWGETGWLLSGIKSVGELDYKNDFLIRTLGTNMLKESTSKIYSFLFIWSRIFCKDVSKIRRSDRGGKGCKGPTQALHTADASKICINNQHSAGRKYCAVLTSHACSQAFNSGQVFR